MKNIPLSPIDHVFTGVGSYPIEFVFAYGSRLDEERLRASLEAVLEHFPPMRSQLVRIADRAFGFQPGEEGLSLVIAESEATFAETEDFTVFIDSVETVEGELLTCDICGDFITTRKHLQWMARKLGPIAYSNPSVVLAAWGEMGLVDEIGSRTKRPLKRTDNMRFLCPRCRRNLIQTEEWG